MKKVLSFILCMAMVFSLTACGEKEPKWSDYEELALIPEYTLAHTEFIVSEESDGSLKVAYNGVSSINYQKYLAKFKAAGYTTEDDLWVEQDQFSAVYYTIGNYDVEVLWTSMEDAAIGGWIIMTVRDLEAAE